MLKTAKSKFTYDKHKLVHFRPGVPFDRMVLLLNSFVDLLSWTADEDIVLHSFYTLVLRDPLLKTLNDWIGHIFNHLLHQSY